VRRGQDACPYFRTKVISLGESDGAVWTHEGAVCMVPVGSEATGDGGMGHSKELQTSDLPELIDDANGVVDAWRVEAVAALGLAKAFGRAVSSEAAEQPGQRV